MASEPGQAGSRPRSTRGRSLKVPGDWTRAGTVWYGRNGKRHGGEFFIGVSQNDSESLRIPESHRRRAARFFEAFAARLREGLE